jgi:hypothetical protein
LLAAYAGMLCYDDPAPADGLFAQALTLAQKIGDPGLLGFVLGEKCFGLQGCMRPAEGVESGLAALPLLRAAGDHWQVTQALIFLQMNLIHVGRFAEAAEVSAEQKVLARRLGHPMARFADVRSSGMRRWAGSGNLADLADLGRADHAVCLELGWSAWSHSSHCWSALAAHLAGDDDRAERFLNEAMAVAESPYFEGFTWGTRLHVSVETGQHERARAMFDEYAEHLPTGPGTHRWGQWAWLCAVAEARVALGDHDEAAVLLPMLLAARSTGVALTSYHEGRLLERVIGMTAAAAGDWALADEAFHLAAAQADSFPHQLERWETRRWWAALLRRRGRAADAAVADELATAAEVGFRGLGMARLAAACSMR